MVVIILLVCFFNSLDLPLICEDALSLATAHQISFKKNSLSMHLVSCGHSDANLMHKAPEEVAHFEVLFQNFNDKLRMIPHTDWSMYGVCGIDLNAPSEGHNTETIWTKRSDKVRMMCSLEVVRIYPIDPQI